MTIKYPIFFTSPTSPTAFYQSFGLVDWSLDEPLAADVFQGDWQYNIELGWTSYRLIVAVLCRVYFT